MFVKNPDRKKSNTGLLKVVKPEIWFEFVDFSKFFGTFLKKAAKSLHGI